MVRLKLDDHDVDLVIVLTGWPMLGTRLALRYITIASMVACMLACPFSLRNSITSFCHTATFAFRTSSMSAHGVLLLLLPIPGSR